MIEVTTKGGKEMTDQEIDKWVEEHVVVPPDDELSEAKRPIYADIVPPIIEWGKNIAHKFYELGKKHNQLNKL